jgi:hypothetical protein
MRVFWMLAGSIATMGLFGREGGINYGWEMLAVLLAMLCIGTMAILDRKIRVRQTFNGDVQDG